jgi:hypothetical protein
MNSDQDLAQLQVEISKLSSTIDQLQSAHSPVDPPLQLCQCPVRQCNVQGNAQRSTSASCSPFVPDYNIPLLAPGGGNTNPTMLQNLGPLAGLIGTWVSQRNNGFNVMPLPQATAPNGFILKNHFYYEVVTFSAIQGKVTNRGGIDEQHSYTLFYEQRVFFSDGVQANTLVHAENGAWLNLIKAPQGQGPLDTQPNIPSPPAPNPIPPQDPALEIVKQVSVPHGTSILANGHQRTFDGAPAIPNVNTLPIGTPPAFAAPYGTDIPSNPNINPNIVLQDALTALGHQGVHVVRTHELSVDTGNHGSASNAPFLKQHIEVTQFANTLWLEELSNGHLMLQYSQNISLKFPQPDGESYIFPHITANTLTKVQ